MKSHFFTWMSPCVLAGIIFPAPIIQAQIMPDASLGETPSIAFTGNDPGRFLITGGVERGTTLFHSFRDFNIGPTESTYFVNPTNISQIVTRVTGDTSSNLLGTLGVLGDADMFFLNPNGIFFGPQSRLDMGGSFVASTAEAVLFEDDFSFSATNPTVPLLLEVNVPSGLQFGQQPGPIVSQVPAKPLKVAIGVETGETLALLGGNLTLQNTRLKATRGHIELGSIAGAGQVTMVPQNNGWTFDYGDIEVFGNLLASRSVITTIETENVPTMSDDAQGGDILIQAAAVNLTGASQVRAGTVTNLPGGNITVNAQRLFMDGGSLLQTSAVAESFENITGNAGDILINASESVVVRGLARDPTRIDATVIGEGVDPDTGGTRGIAFGNGGDIVINTPQLLVKEGAQIGTISSSVGDAGNITINASDSVEISGVFQRNGGRRSGILTGSSGAGAGGDLSINTKDLRILQGGGLRVDAEGTGAGGNAIINADTVKLIGSTSVSETLTTFSSTILARTSDAGDAGTVLVNARVIELREGGRISTITGQRSRGNSNLIRVNATEAITIDGGAATKRRGFVPSGLISNTRGTGQAGPIEIITDELRIENGGRITSSTLNESAQSSGGLDLTVNYLVLDQDAEIRVDTRATEGSGAEIRISDFDMILLRNGSLITAEAFNSADGGNVILSSSEGFVIAPLAEDSDIIARSNLGDGGRIAIVAQGIFGLEERLALPGNGTNDLDASSRLGQSGTVSLNELGTEPNQEQANLPETIGTDEINRQCQPSTSMSSFIVSGQGGIPAEISRPGLLWETLDEISTTESPTNSNLTLVDPSLTVSPLQEAQGWHVNGSGQPVLVAPTANPIPYTKTSTAYCALRNLSL